MALPERPIVELVESYYGCGGGDTLDQGVILGWDGGGLSGSFELQPGAVEKDVDSVVETTQ